MIRSTQKQEFKALLPNRSGFLHKNVLPDSMPKPINTGCSDCTGFTDLHDREATVHHKRQWLTADPNGQRRSC